MFRFFGGVPKLLVPDNLKSGVNKASFYDPEINRTSGAMATHYSVGILPANPEQQFRTCLGTLRLGVRGMGARGST
jgi:transposase